MSPEPRNLDEAVMQAREAMSEIRVRKSAAYRQLERVHHWRLGFNMAIRDGRHVSDCRGRLEHAAVFVSDLQIEVEDLTRREAIILDALREARVSTDL